MASASDIKFYKSASGGLGGAIDTGAQILSTSFNNLFPALTETQANTGVTHYLCMYIKNTHATETVKQLSLLLNGISTGSTSQVSWAKGIAGKNASEATIANIDTAPAGVTDWKNISNTYELFDDFAASDRWGIWIRWIVPAGDITAIDDSAFFKFKFNITGSGTGTGGDPGGGGTGGTGGNPTPPTDWKIAVAGDWGCESETDDVMDLCEGYDLVIGVGDNSYDGSASCWTNRVTSHNLKSKMISAYGNHEHEESSGLTPYLNYFGHTNTFYRRTFQNVGIMVIDSNKNMDPGSTQHDRVVGWLQDWATNPDIDWIFATWHHPTYGASSQHSHNDGDSAEAFWDLFNDYKVAFLFTGHNHNWSRTKQLTWSGSYASPTVTDSTTPFVKTNAMIEVRSGTGGHDSGSGLYSLGSQPSYVGYQNRTHNGIYEILASNSGQTLTCSFVDTNGDKYDTIVYTLT